VNKREGMTAVGMKVSACGFFAWIFDPEDGDNMLLRNIS
jgi:hypothetical protein